VSEGSFQEYVDPYILDPEEYFRIDEAGEPKPDIAHWKKKERSS